MKYKIKVWVPIETDISGNTIYTNRAEAIKEKINLEFMQPENKYDIEEI